jgi:hypothetical protein
MEVDERVYPAYEAPAIVVVGPVGELTLGSGEQGPADGSATYIGISDARLKRRVRLLPDTLSRLHSLGEPTGR